MVAHVSIDRDRISNFCRRHHIRRLALFGSVLRDDFRPDSDVDVLVEFDPRHIPGMEFLTMDQELTALLGRKVDLLTFTGVRQMRNPLRRRAILNNHETIYAADGS